MTEEELKAIKERVEETTPGLELELRHDVPEDTILFVDFAMEKIPKLIAEIELSHAHVKLLEEVLDAYRSQYGPLNFKPEDAAND